MAGPYSDGSVYAGGPLTIEAGVGQVRDVFRIVDADGNVLFSVNPDGTVAPSGATDVPDADATTKGVVKLAGDLSGTADLPTVVDVASALKDPSAGMPGLRTLGTGAQQALPGNTVIPAATPDADAATKGKLQLAGHLSGTAALPTVVDVAAALKDPATGSAGLRTLGTGSQQAAAGNDARLSDQRVPSDASVTNAKVATGAAIARSKLDFGTGLVDADIAAAASIAKTKLAALAIADADVATLAAIAVTKLAAGSDGKFLRNIGGTNQWASVALAPDLLDANPFLGKANNAGGTQATALLPVFFPVIPPDSALPTFTVAGIKFRCTTNLAASTAGVAIYTYSYSAAQTGTMSLVANTTVQVSTASGTAITGTLASPVTLDFSANRYMIGFMASSASTLAFAGLSVSSGTSGAVQLGAALASTATASWPATVTLQASATTTTTAQAASSTQNLPWLQLVSSSGLNYL